MCVYSFTFVGWKDSSNKFPLKPAPLTECINSQVKPSFEPKRFQLFGAQSNPSV